MCLESSALCSTPFYRLLDGEFRIKGSLDGRLFGRLAGTGRSLSEQESKSLWEFLGVNPVEVVTSKQLILQDLSSLEHPGVHVGIRGIPIKIDERVGSRDCPQTTCS